jgi:peptidoglycan/xylan/chitin deacetylase (PgdA/CDA1 family)
VWIVLSTHALAAGRPVVVFTIDVESNAQFRLPDQIDAVCEDGSACGLMEIARLLSDRGWPGTFFLNVYEHRQWGETAMRDIAVRLQRSGQDVGLHTHPDSAYDRARREMYEYSLDEQTVIIREGVQRLRTWTGLPVVSHRAGAYSADARTLAALEQNGIVVDSSRFWTNPKSRLDGLGLPRNLPARHGRLAEIPVTVYYRDDQPHLFGGAVAPGRVVRKIDVDWVTNEDEMRQSIDAAVAADLPVLVFFLHSFSFMNRRSDGTALADRHSIDMFRAMLDHVARKQLPVVTMRDLAARELPLPSAAGDVIPSVTVRVDIPRYLWRRLKAADALSLTGIGLVLLSAIAVVLTRWWRTATGRRTSGVQQPAVGGLRR